MTKENEKKLHNAMKELWTGTGRHNANAEATLQEVKLSEGWDYANFYKYTDEWVKKNIRK